MPRNILVAIEKSFLEKNPPVFKMLPNTAIDHNNSSEDHACKKNKSEK